MGLDFTSHGVVMKAGGIITCSIIKPFSSPQSILAFLNQPQERKDVACFLLDILVIGEGVILSVFVNGYKKVSVKKFSRTPAHQDLH
jgi:hypothetical protein